MVIEWTCRCIVSMISQSWPFANAFSRTESWLMPSVDPATDSTLMLGVDVDVLLMFLLLLLLVYVGMRLLDMRTATCSNQRDKAGQGNNSTKKQRNVGFEMCRIRWNMRLIDPETILEYGPPA